MLHANQETPSKLLLTVACCVLTSDDMRPGGIGRYDLFRQLQRRQCWGRNARNLGSRFWNLGCLQRRLCRYRLAP